MTPRSEEVLGRLSGGLVVSVQPVQGGPMDDDGIVAAMAEAAVEGGAAGLRIEGARRLARVRSRLPDVPIIGIVKRDLAETPVRITPLPADVSDLVEAGGDIVAIDGTDRARPHAFSELAAVAAGAGRLVMADVSTETEGREALDDGAQILGSTLSGYAGPVAAEAMAAPDLALVTALARLGAFVMAEGRYSTPALTAKALRAGADGVTVGSALTRLEIAAGEFARAIETASYGFEQSADIKREFGTWRT